MNYVYKGKFKSTKTVFSEIQANTVGQLPIPIVSILVQSPFEKLATQIIALKRDDPTADTSSMETQIDRLVYQLYGLTEDEISIVESSTEKPSVLIDEEVRTDEQISTPLSAEVQI